MVDRDQVAGAEPRLSPKSVPHLPVQVDGVVHVHSPDIVVDPPEESPLSGCELCHHLVDGADADRAAEELVYRTEGTAVGTAAGGLEIAVDVVGVPEIGDWPRKTFEIGKTALVDRFEFPFCSIIEEPAPDLLGLAEDDGIGMQSRFIREGGNMDPPRSTCFPIDRSRSAVR